LANRLRAQGLVETKASIANKLSRGTASAAFFVATLTALGRAKIDLSDL
jgi:hypothetical protein